MWSLACVIIMLAGIGLLIWGWAFLRSHDPEPQAPASDPVLAVGLTPSQKALGKYLFVVVALFIFQVFIGGFTAHYTIEGQAFYGLQDRKRVVEGTSVSVRVGLGGRSIM